MNATKIAKGLVVLNVAMAVAFLTWAIAVVSQRIDWFSPAEASGGEKVLGQLEKLAESIKIQEAAYNKAYSLWVINKAQVDSQERDRPLRRDFYRGQIALAQTGLYGGKEIPKPFQKFVERADGLMDIRNPTDRESINHRLGSPLLSIRKYEALNAEATRGIQATKSDIAGLIESLKGVNDQIFKPDGSGLRKDIAEQEEILNSASRERKYLDTSNYNLQAETTLFTKRLGALKARLNELESARQARTEDGEKSRITAER